MNSPSNYKQSSDTPNVGLVLSGGGARGAYQAGVIKAIAEISENNGVKKPLPILTGVSAGAINSTFLAANSENLFQASNDLASLWSRLTSEQVFRTTATSAGISGLRLLSDAAFGALYGKKLAKSLLDTTPLAYFLDKHIKFDKIERNLRLGHIDSLAITAMNYTSAHNITFVQATEHVPMWHRSRRRSQMAKIKAEHVMASSAIPLFFPPVAVDNHHYGDGCLRNSAPLSPAIHLGANRVMVISVRKADAPYNPEVIPTIEPSLARVIGVVLNALILDAIDVDMERMSRVNQTLTYVPETLRDQLHLRKVDYFWIRPSRDIGQLAGELFNRLPKVIRYLVAGLGSSREAAELTSYLLFDPDFCGQLVQLGYDDAMTQEQEIQKFLFGS